MLRTCGILAALALSVSVASAQTTTGDILGTVRDASGAAMADSKVTIRNLETNIAKETSSGPEGTFRVPLLPSGSYELVVEKGGFARYVQRPIQLRLNQQADITVNMSVAATSETVNVTSDAPLINTTNAEVSTNFDTKRIAEVPFSVNRNIINLALNVPGVSQLSTGQSSFAAGGSAGTDTAPSFSANGMRVRSNNFMLDGQDVNDPSVTGLNQGINNQDIVAEFRVITNQFNAEYGRAAGSVVNIITKSGTNAFHGSLFWFYNGNKLNARNNQDVQLGRTDSRFAQAPFRIENQFGGSVGGPVIKDRTFFFGSLLRWTDRRLGSGSVITGAPTEAGRQVLQSLAGNQTTVRALLENLPAAQVPSGATQTFTFNGQTGVVPLGSLSGSSNIVFNAWQGSGRVDHKLSDKHMLGGRYIFDDQISDGAGQATPEGLTNSVPTRRQSIEAHLNSTFSPNMFNEFRVGFNRFASVTNALNPEIAERIPAIQVNSLGLTGFNADTTRTGLGLAVNLPQFRRNNTYQLANNTSIIHGLHNFKFGLDFRYTDLVSLFLPQIRGSLTYVDLNALVNDTIQSGQINVPLPGGETLFYARWNDYFFFAQDEWRLNSRLTLNYGLRYESFGDALSRLQSLNQRIITNANNNPGYSFGQWPGGDHNNWAPRFGFNFRINDSTVVRGGYARTYDYSFLNIGLNIFSAFPFVIANSPAAGTVGGFQELERLKGVFNVPNPLALTRTTVASDFRSPFAEQFSFNVQRSIGRNWAGTVGWVGTKGTGLFQTIDANPRVPVPGAAATARVDPARGVIRLRANAASSVYHSLQTSLEKRYGNGLVFSGHYTWSSFIDDASEVFNAAVSGDVAVPQDSFNRKPERGRSSYDRPHRFTTTAVYELPWLREQKGLLGKIGGGWQVNGFLTLQSGAPFTPLAGIDPGVRLGGIDSLVGNSVRPFVSSNLGLSSLTVEELRAYNIAAPPGATSVTPLFTNVTVQNPLGNAGRNILRADGIGNVDFGIIKNTLITENHRIQIRGEVYNLTNTRNFGIPESRINSVNFLNQWGTNGGNRRVQVGLRYTF